MKHKLTRRQILAGGTAAAAFTLGASAKGETATISADTFKACEQLLGVSYTPDERHQLLETVDDHLDRIRSLRALKQPNQLSPAMTFDPRLPSWDEDGLVSFKHEAVTEGKPLPTSEEDIAFAPISDLQHWISSRQISAVDLTKLYLRRIKRFGPMLECFVTVTEELALNQARKMDKLMAEGKRRGPLHGIPYVVKDLFDTKDTKTTWGATPYKDRVAEDDAWVVNVLRNAGAILLGKTTCGALAYGDVWFGGRTRNPWNMEEGSSGSSAGSAAATAAGLCGFSIGTETLGSIISPSNRCGVAGLRPTFGRVARTGGMALCWSLDKVGPICRTASDCLAVLAEINGPDGVDRSALNVGFDFSTPALQDLTIGYDPAWFEGEEAHSVDVAAFEALKEFGVKLKEIKIADRPYGALLTILLAEAAAAFEELTEDNLDDLLVWQGKDAWPNSFREARFISAIDLVNTDRLRRTVMGDMNELFSNVDLIAGPNYASSLLTITNYTGHPQLTLRAGFYESSGRGFLDREASSEIKNLIPRNFSLWAPLFQEGLLVEVGSALEKSLGAWKRRPNLV